MNICCALSQEGNNSLRLLRRPQLIELLLAHIGLFTENSDLEPLYHKEWFPKTRRNFTKVGYCYKGIQYLYGYCYCSFLNQTLFSMANIIVEYSIPATGC